MTPRNEATTDDPTTTTTTAMIDDTITIRPNKKNSDGDTKVIQPDPDRDITYIHCTSKGPIPEHILSSSSSSTQPKSAQDINETELRLCFGYPFLHRSKNPITVKVIQFVFTILLVEYWEQYVYYILNHVIPIRLKRYIIYQLWYIYFPIHRHVFHNRTGIHPHASLEYHALTTSMYWFRFLPNSIVRMRLALRQLTCSQPQPSYCRRPYHGQIETIDTDFLPTETSSSSSSSTSSSNPIPILPPDRQKNFCRVKGLYLHYQHQQHHHQNHNSTNHNPMDDPTEYTLFWLYGGAFLSGDVHGNLGPADTIAYHSHQMDAFIVEYRLAPEYEFDDIVWDVVLAYRYLYELRRSRQQDPNKILLFGCSSGAALCIRLMQYISEIQQQQYDTIQPSYISSLLDGTMMPSGAVLASPYLDYSADLDPHGSFVQYRCHDLVVTEAVQEVGLPYLNTHMGPSGNRTTNSPLYHTMKHLPPLCIVVSQHETVYDETMRFIHAARRDGVPVTVGVWKYMCHVFLFFNGFIPEAKQAMDFICSWYKEYTYSDN